MFNRSKIALAFALTVALSALVASPGLAASTRGTDLETYTGSVSAGAPSTVAFTTFANDTGVILSFKARAGGARTLKVYDPAGTLVSWIDVPGEVTGVWSTYVPVTPSTTYRVEISVGSGSTKYTFYVNHCPDGVCF